jgi:uncharacterized protein YuzE
MMFRYDDEADALYVYFRHIEPGGAKDVRNLDEFRNVDLDAAGNPIGVEFLCVKDGVDLTGVPRAEEIEKLLRNFRPAVAVRS